MTRQGFEAPKTRVISHQSDDFRSDEARKQGYDRWIIPDEGSELSPSALSAFLGDPGRVAKVTIAGASLSVGTSGCLGDARRRVFGDLKAWLAGNEIVANLEVYSGSKVSDRRDWKALNQQWSQCMAKHGIGDLLSPEESIAPAQKQRSGAIAPPAVEITTAVLDAGCRDATSLPSKRAQIRNAFEKSAAVRFAPELRQYVEVLQRAQ